MQYRYTRTIEMTPAGDLLPRPWRLGWAGRVGVVALLVAIGAAVTSAAALFLWLASVLLPIAIIAAGIAYVAFRLQLWRLKAS
jgi:uncharacterized membrane protein